MAHGRIRASLAETSGIDAPKILMAGADVTLLCSVLLRQRIGTTAVIEREMCEWSECTGGARIPLDGAAQRERSSPRNLT